MFFASVVLIVGFVFLFKNLGFISGDVWSIVWPCLLIALGLGILLNKKKRECKREEFREGMKKFGEEMHKTFRGKEKKN